MRFLLVVFMALVSYMSLAQPVHEYKFDNTLNDVVNLGPPLQQSLKNSGCAPTAGSFATETVPFDAGNCNGLITPIFNFTQGGGLKHPNVGFISTNYTIHIFFKFNTLPGLFEFNRVIDFRNGATDKGLYISGDLSLLGGPSAPTFNFYVPGFLSPGNPIGPTLVANNYYLVTLVRSTATSIVELFLNGQPIGTFNDAIGDYVPTGNPIILFDDDANGGTCEEGAGKIKYFSVSNGTSTPTQIGQLYTNLCVVLLPVKFTKFTAVATANTTNLQWAIENANDVQYFDVEKSTDAAQYFKISSLQPNSTNSYSFKEFNNFTAKSYYRIKATLKDGTVKYSEVRLISKQTNDEVLVYPNPVVNRLEVQLPFGNKYSQYEIINTIGKSIISNNIAKEVNNVEIQLNNLPAGMYTLKLISKDKLIYKNFVKQ
jgi:Secretion system C-terminal sorting domain